MRATATTDIPPIAAYLKVLGSRLHVEDDMHVEKTGGPSNATAIIVSASTPSGLSDILYQRE